MSYTNGTVSIGTAATRICTPGPQGALVQNCGTAVLYVGGPDVAAANGLSIGTAGVTALIVDGTAAGTVGGDEGVYWRTAANTTVVAFLGVV